MTPYVPLNLRSFYSFHDSLLPVRTAVDRAAELKLPAIAITDPNLHGAVELFQAAQEAGIHAVMGAQVTPASDLAAPFPRPVLLYVKNQIGYTNLCHILSQPNPTRPFLRDHASGLIPIPVPSRPPWGRNPLGATPLFLPEIRYLHSREQPDFEIIQSIRTLTRVGQTHPDKHYGNFSFPTATEALHLCGGDPGPLRETLRLAEECTFSFTLGGLRFPSFPTPDGSPSSVFLRTQVIQGASLRYGANSTLHRRVLRQISEELSIITEVGYADYFLLVWDLLQTCRAKGIDWITRGSAADSLVCYCLGISGVCPIRFDLYFRRFLNRDRMAMNKLPDIDIDFPHDRRNEVIDLLFQKHGPDHCAVVGGFSTYQGRSALAEIAKTLGASEFQVRRLTRQIPHVHARNLSTALAERVTPSDPSFEEDPYATAIQLAARLDGFPRHPKMHPCGVVLSGPPILQLTPVFPANSGYPTTHLDMHSVENLGLVKMDILGQAGLSVLRDACAQLRARGVQARFGISTDPLPPSPLVCRPLPLTAEQLDLERLAPWDDPTVWKMIAHGCARGVHHIESPAMTTLHRLCGTADIDCLIAIVSVIRPGAANELKKDEFARRYQGLSPIQYAHPSLEPVLRSTFGLIAYEEHILQVCEVFAGWSAGRADALRRALTKQDPTTIDRLGREFSLAALEKNRTLLEINQVWNLLLGFQGYAFCRAHSTAYGVEAYQAAVLKRYHPREFMSAVLTHGKGFYSRLAYSLECHRLGIPLLPPDVHQSDATQFLAQPTGIRTPLSVIQEVGDALPLRIVHQRTHKPFCSLMDFLTRVQPNSAAMTSLLRVGALDCLAPSRTQLFWEWRRHETLTEQDALGLFQKAPRDLPRNLQEPTSRQRLLDEHALLGFTTSGHPLDLYPEIEWSHYCPIQELIRFPSGRVKICGLIVAERTHRQSDGRWMKFLTLADRTGMVETELFADANQKWGATASRYPVLAVTGKVEAFPGGRGITLHVLRLDPPTQKSQRRNRVLA